MNLQSYKFVVNETPYCVYIDGNIKQANLDFLNQIDTNYYTHLAQLHNTVTGEEAIGRSAIALRGIYSQALETMFALMASMLQAPLCTHGWLLKYKNHELYEFIQKINENKLVLTRYPHERFKWINVSRLIFENMSLDDKDLKKDIENKFAQVWSRFAVDFLHPFTKDEYNSLKHGFRIKSGGFHLSIRPNEKSWQSLGGSKYGSTFPISESIAKSNKILASHFHIKTQNVNWHPEDLIYGIYLIAMSINNIVSALKCSLGEEAKFEWPTDKDFAEKPWLKQSSIGIRSVNYGRSLDSNNLKLYTKQEILDDYQNT